MNATAYSDRAAWLRARRASLGGSDVPAVLGISSYATPLSCWASKVRDVEVGESTYSQRRGAHMERFVAEELAAAVDGLKVERLWGSEEFVIARHAEEPVLAYSPDALLVDPEGTTVLGEWKSNLRGGRRWQDEVPLEVQAQVQHGMHVLDLPAAYVAVDLGHEMRWERVERDPAYADGVVPVLLDWWRDHVVAGVAPEPTGRVQDKRAVEALWPEDHGGEVALPREMVDDAVRLEWLEGEIKSLEGEREAIRNRVRLLLGEATRGVLPDGSGWTWKTQKRAEYVVRASEFRVLRRFLARG